MDDEADAAGASGADGTPRSRRRPRQGLETRTRDRLSLQLRAMYDHVVQQPVPDRFRDLIARLDDAEPEDR